MVYEIKPKKKTPNLEVIDLFCGAGGLTHGLIAEGLRVVAGIDIDSNCQFSFEHNNAKARFINRDIGEITQSEILCLHKPNTIRVLIGCAPCQPFSTYSRAHRKHTVDDRWGLLQSFSRLIEQTKPHIVSMENVPQLIQHPIFSKFMDALTGYGYSVSEPTLAYCPDYGVPQQRKRLVVFGSLFGSIQLVNPRITLQSTMTVKGAIGHLRGIGAGERDKNDNLHRSSDLSAINLKRMRCSVPGGTWRDWPSDLVASCHKRETGATYPAVYGRMEWDKPSPTITTQFFGYGNGRFGHPSQDRALSLREGAILQSFPETYQFEPADSELSFHIIGRMIGNAVPVNLARAIGRTIKLHVAYHSKIKGRL